MAIGIRVTTKMTTAKVCQPLALRGLFLTVFINASLLLLLAIRAAFATHAQISTSRVKAFVLRDAPLRPRLIIVGLLVASEEVAKDKSLQLALLVVEILIVGGHVVEVFVVFLALLGRGLGVHLVEYLAVKRRRICFSSDA